MDKSFLPPADPLQRLPQPEYEPWETLAAALPDLLAVGRARGSLEQLPVLPIAQLSSRRERMRALLLLSIFAHASVWGNCSKPYNTIPPGVAVPLRTLAELEGMPPILTHASIVLNNWRRLDPSGPIEALNLACTAGFLGGQDETWFIAVTVEIEARGGGVIAAILQAQHAIDGVGNSRCAREGMAAGSVVLSALRVIEKRICGMMQSLLSMTDRCHPFIFYERIRPFLSGWKGNPTLPDGVLYQGIDVHRREYHGGSAAQCSLFPALDAALGVSHSRSASNDFLRETRNYMPPGHRRLVEYLYDPARPSIRRFVETTYLEHAALRTFSPQAHSPAKGDEVIAASGVHGIPDGGSIMSGKSGKASEGMNEQEMNERPTRDEKDDEHSEKEMRRSTASDLMEAYNRCLQALEELRSTHLAIVSSYIVRQQKRSRKALGEHAQGDNAGGKGTGGTPLFEFLKPLRDNVRATLLAPRKDHSPLPSASRA